MLRSSYLLLSYKLSNEITTTVVKDAGNCVKRLRIALSTYTVQWSVQWSEDVIKAAPFL